MYGCYKYVNLALRLHSFPIAVSKGSNSRLKKFAGEADNKHHREAGEAVCESNKVTERLIKTDKYALPVGNSICVTLIVISVTVCLYKNLSNKKAVV